MTPNGKVGKDSAKIGGHVSGARPAQAETAGEGRSFPAALQNFLEKAGLWTRRTNWIREKVGLDDTFLRRWLRGSLPSTGSWRRFESAVHLEFADDELILKELEKLTSILTATREQVAEERRIARRQSKARPTRKDNTPATAWAGLSPARVAKILLARFLADTRIAGQLATETGRRALYLSQVYVHRKKIEDVLVGYVRGYLETEEPPEGQWLSIEGDAGHGKTSLLWWLAGELQRLTPLLFPVQALQLDSAALEELRRSVPLDGKRFVVILDTLDLLVGVDDVALASVVNDFRARGGLLVTACRHQELQSFARYTRSNYALCLGRYESEEARSAINRYVRASYPEWPESRREAQATHIWELLDERRRIQEISYEPLLLTMIFEAYVPEDIPRDVNTQQVYDRFWTARVLGDHLPLTPEEIQERQALCRELAAYLYFEGAAQQDRMGLEDILRLGTKAGLSRPAKTVDSLLSSGVLRWWQAKTSVAFFHQTFLEYTAAKYILELTDIAERRVKTDHLLADVEGTNLFRIPILKQLMVQASLRDSHLFEGLCNAVTQIDSPVALRLTLEVLGKAHDATPLDRLVLAWRARQPALFHAVALEVVRHYPASRVDLAFEILRPQVDAETAGEVCAACETFFAPMAPEKTRQFLTSAWRAEPAIFEERGLTSALIAAFRAGDADALGALAEILPRQKAGVQAGALGSLADTWTSQHATNAALFLVQLFDGIASSDSNESRAAFSRAFASLIKLDPAEGGRLITTLQSRIAAVPPQRVAILLARLVGIAGPSSEHIARASTDLLSTDHTRRLCALELLYEAGKSNRTVVERLLRMSVPEAISLEVVNGIYWIASGCGSPKQMLAVLDRWAPTEKGAGNAYRVLVENAAKASPERTLTWLKQQMKSAKSGARRRQVLVGFQMLAVNATGSIPPADVRLFLEWGFSRPDATDEMRRIFASAAGWIADIETTLAKDVFRRIFATRRRDCINALINSLRGIRSEDCIPFVLDLVIAFVARERVYATLGHFLEATSQRTIELRTALLRRLAAPDSLGLLGSLDDPVVVGRVLWLLKSTVRAELATALRVADSCPILNDGNRAALSALMENVSRSTTAPKLLRTVLTRLLDLASVPHNRIRNSLLAALPRLDHLLPHREVAEAVVAKMLSATDWSEDALENLARAAKRMDGWTPGDSETLLRSDLPTGAKAALLS